MERESSRSWSPRVLLSERDGRGLLEELSVPADLSCFEGHFPGNPILPGYLLISWAHAAASRMRTGRLTGMKKVKFQRPVLPGALLTLRIDGAPESERLEFSYSDGSGAPVCSGSLIFNHED